MARRRKLPLIVLLAVAAIVGVRWAGRPRIDPRLVGSWTNSLFTQGEARNFLTLYADGTWSRSLSGCHGIQFEPTTWRIEEGDLVMQSKLFWRTPGGTLHQRFSSFARKLWACVAEQESFSFQEEDRYVIDVASEGSITLMAMPSTSPFVDTLVLGGNPVAIAESQPEKIEPRRLVRWNLPP